MTTSPMDTTDHTTDAYKLALSVVQPRLELLTDTDLAAINIDITGAVKTVLGALPRIREVVVPAGAVLPGFDAAHFDDLELLARAAGWAHARFRGADVSAEPIDTLYRAMTDVRERLIADYTALTKRGVVDGHLLGAFRGPVGFQNTVDDVLAIVGQLDAHEPDVLANSGIKAGDLARIREQALRFVEALGRREQAAPVSPEVVSTRARAFTLFVRAYDQVRRSVSYVRWNEGDADEIAPSLYSRPHSSKSDAAPAAAAAPAPVTPATPAAPAAAPTAPTAPAPSALRGGDPYVR